jgi:hypothetical protein
MPNRRSCTTRFHMLTGATVNASPQVGAVRLLQALHLCRRAPDTLPMTGGPVDPHASAPLLLYQNCEPGAPVACIVLSCN